MYCISYDISMYEQYNVYFCKRTKYRIMKLAITAYQSTVSLCIKLYINDNGYSSEHFRLNGEFEKFVSHSGRSLCSFRRMPIELKSN